MPPATLRRARGVHAIKTGTLRSRWGSVALFTGITAHSLYRFRDARFAGSGSELYRDGIIIRGGLNGDRLRFVRMPPTPGQEDYLFVAGGGELFKVSPAGAVSGWGLAAPQVDFSAAVGAAGVLNGTYQYAVTFLNQTTGSRSNPNPAQFTGPITVAPANQQVNLTGLPISPESQVTAREIWRTFANQGLFFRLAVISNNTATSYTDNAPDSDLETLELPLDNDPPDDSWNDAIGPYNGRMFWTRSSIAGEEGRIFYSPQGRPESVEGFIEVNNGDDPVVRLTFWGGVLYAHTNAHVIRVLGFDPPFTWQEVYGAPGTTKPFSVTPTPFGIVHDSIDGIRVFDGTASRLIGFEAIGRLLAGEALEDVPPFDPVVGEFAGREIWLSDGATTLVLDPNDGSWRIAQGGVSALYFEPDTQVLVGAAGSTIVQLEPANVTTDNGVPISFEIETPGAITDAVVRGLVQRMYLDVDTADQLLTPTLVLDNDEIPLPVFKTSGRPAQAIEYDIGRWGRVVSVRLEGELTAQVTVYEISLDVYVPGER